MVQPEGYIGKEESKANELLLLANSRRGRPNLTIISPFGSVLTSENKMSMLSVNNNGPNINPDPDSFLTKRTSSSLAKLVDYDDEMEFNMETKGRDANNFMIEGNFLKSSNH